VSDRGYVLFSEDEVARGIAYAREKHGIELHRVVLRSLANDTREAMARDKAPFEDARHRVMSRTLTQRSAEEVAVYEAYESALGKMFNERSQYARARRPSPPRKRSRRKKEGVSKDPETGQLAWII
jgi:hypothetical protein